MVNIKIQPTGEFWLFILKTEGKVPLKTAYYRHFRCFFVIYIQKSDGNSVALPY